MPEVLGDAAAYFDPLNVVGMAHAIAEVVDNAKLRATMITKGEAQAAKYSWRTMAEQTHQVYMNAIKNTGA
jgi:glycosyltransferase involved in cell wall biosynthesis